MPGTVKVWWHDGSTLDARHHPTPLIAEPEIAFETLAVGTAAPVATAPAPGDAHLAVLESPVTLRYRVLRPGEAGDAADAQAKPLPATLPGIAVIGLEPGCTLSLIEEA